MENFFQIKDVLIGVGISSVFLLIEEIIFWIKKEKVSIVHRIFILLFGLYLSFIFEGTVSPIYGWSMNNVGNNINLVPFQVLKTMQSNPLNFFGNIIMMIPLGILLVLLSKRCKKFWVTLLIGMGMSMLIEFIQLFETRGTDIDDLLLNTIGTMLGWIVGRIFLQCSSIIQKSSGIAPLVLLGVLVLSVTMGRGFIRQNEYLNQEADTNTVALNLLAKNVYIYSVNNHKCLYEKKAQEKIAPASTTKILTALTVLDYCKETEEITVGKEILRAPADASKAQLLIGAKLTVRQLLEALLLPSGDDAAYTLAVYTGKKISHQQNLTESETLQCFVEKMNKKAQNIGAQNSKFMTPDGYDAIGQYTTAEDLAKIAEKSMSSSTLMKIMGTYELSQLWKSGENIDYLNTDEMIDPNSSYYRNKVIAGKTGHSGKAGSCLVFIMQKQKENYICVVMNSTKKGRFDDAVRIYDTLEKTNIL